MRIRRVAACLAATALAASAGFSPCARAGDAPDSAVVTVQTVRVQRGEIAQPVRAYGIVAASAQNVTTVNLPYLARIVQMRVQPGQAVKRGAPLAVVQADPSAVLAAAQARSALALAQGELGRTQSLYDKGLATQSQLAAAKKALLDAEQALGAQEQLGTASGNKMLVAPMDGVVLQVSVAQGDQVQPGAAILQLAAGASGNDARANVVLGIEPSDAAAVHVGDTITLHGLSTALAKAVATGRVVMVGASVDAQSQLVDVGANVPLGQTAFIPGTRVSADIATLTGTHWVVPRSAVLKDENGEYVFQVTPDHKAQRITVFTRVEDADRYGVDGMLNASEPLVVSGNYELQDGMAVQIAGSAAR
ncbi:efflux RND transporter periplasmic adaptor subunit [Paraburkholderia mimosarum]|uniref:efflux RND transporter periplasmic adaptor subunit n=1 Tax=Paraburkholderia mimosarum TaxID=312026 RepID=UPI001FC8B07E|nr:efflux RND transporter periplasmic adaptor subunit [Paraburkholderia mimosarum]